MAPAPTLQQYEGPIETGWKRAMTAFPPLPKEPRTVVRESQSLITVENFTKGMRRRRR